MGVGAIKVDFGEGAPLDAIYANGRSGLYEHNLYPLRYNKTVAEVIKKIHGEKHYLGTFRMGRLTTLPAALGR